MLRVEKLPSGSYRCRVMRKGRRKSFTARTKAECRQMAVEWLSNLPEGDSVAVKDEVEDYIASREKSLSPSTVAAYRSYQKNAYGDIEDRTDLSDRDVQRWLDKYAEEHSPKTCANALGLLTVSLGRTFRVRIPERKKPNLYTPTDNDIKKILDGADDEVKKAVALAAFGTLRRGEVCALTYGDIEGNIVHVTKALTWKGKGYVTKNPKTVESVRDVALPKSALKIIGKGKKNQRVVDLTPAALTKRFKVLLKEVGVHPFRFHDLRAYSASVRHALGIPDQYIMRDGGWKTDAVLKSVYRRAMDDKRKEFSEITTKHFDEVMAKSWPNRSIKH